MGTGRCLPAAPAGQGGAWECTPGSPEPATAAGRRSGALLQAWAGQTPSRLLLCGACGGWASQCWSTLVLASSWLLPRVTGTRVTGTSRRFSFRAGERPAQRPGHGRCGAPGEVTAAVSPALRSLRRRRNCLWSAGSALSLAGSSLSRPSQETAQERGAASQPPFLKANSAALYFREGEGLCWHHTAGHRRLLVAGG